MKTSRIKNKNFNNINSLKTRDLKLLLVESEIEKREIKINALEKETKEKAFKITLLTHLIKEQIHKNILSKNVIIHPATVMKLQENYMSMFS
jgi:hypothetical protein